MKTASANIRKTLMGVARKGVDVREYLAAKPVHVYTVFGLGKVYLSFDVQKNDFKVLINRLSYERLNKFIKVDQISRNRVKNTFQGRLRSVATLFSPSFSLHH